MRVTPDRSCVCVASAMQFFLVTAQKPWVNAHSSRLPRPYTSPWLSNRSFFCAFGRARLVPSGWHGLGMWCSALRGTLPNQLGQARDLSQAANSVEQIGPEVHTQLPARLFQAGEGVPAASPFVAPRTTADLAPLHVLADIRLFAIVV